GPIPVTNTAWRHPIVEAFVEDINTMAGVDNPDYNGAFQHGAHRTQRFINKGYRAGAAQTYLRVARKRPNLTIWTRQSVSRVLFDGRQATGVVCGAGAGSAKTTVARARREVILSAGSVNTPRLLQISGVGPGALLQRLGIDPVAD